ncbi:MAG TPA: hypothetical protein VNX18_13430 [Bryobacteraceae bacterium]|nr:hypothetical protein [Bryobacteraceae bacterium]
MRQRLYHRLQQLEALRERLRKVRDWAAEEKVSSEKALSKFRLFLRLRGIEQEPTESLAEASARALEIRPRELKELLLAGIDPIHKFFEERGVFEEIEREKPPGRGPAAEEITSNVRL